jgi:hypothetical protein
METNEIEKTLTDCGWIQDRHGNFKSVSGKVRIKMQTTSVRVENEWVPPVSEYNPKPAKQWICVVSDYKKNLSVKNGQLVIKGSAIKKQDTWRDL